MGNNRALQECIRAACLLEAAAPKPGNVHPQAAFADLDFGDFVRSAETIAPVLSRAAELGVGAAVLEAVRRTAELVGRNTNLGIILLIAPLAAVPRSCSLADGIADVLQSTMIEDARLVYQAIRLAAPGGMGCAAQEDLSTEPTMPLRDCMRLAAERDLVAREYATGFRIVLTQLVPFLTQPDADEFPSRWAETITFLHLRLMATHPDTLVARKSGWEVAQESARLAEDVFRSGWPRTSSSRQKFQHLDEWLRADGNRRNPGTTADLIAAGLFAALREGHIQPPALDFTAGRVETPRD